MTDGDLFDRIEAMRAGAPGWCWPEKARKLAEAVLATRPAVCVEIGVFGGSSLVPMAAAVHHVGAGRVYGIDPWETDDALHGVREKANVDFWSAVDLEGVYRTCRDLLARHHLDEVCELVRARAADVAGRFADGSVGLLHIDGNHGEERSTQDAVLYLPKVADGGYIFFDDVNWVEQGVATTQRALDYLLANGCEVVEYVGACAILRKVGTPPACRWREHRAGGRLACHSVKYIDPPNRVTLDFCAGCVYRDHPPDGLPPARPAAEAPDDLLPVNPSVPPRPGADGVPPIFCITCRQTPERTAAAAAHFRGRGLAVQFFPGIHGRTFGLRTVLHAAHDYRIPAGHVGLILSHYMLWQTLAFLPHDATLVLEDDAHVPPDFPERFRAAYADLPADWQWVYVGGLFHPHQVTRRVSARVGVVYNPLGTHAYLVRRSALPHLLRTNHQARTHLDIQLLENSLPGLNAYAFVPPLAGQHTAEGTWPGSASAADEPDGWCPPGTESVPGRPDAAAS